MDDKNLKEKIERVLFPVTVIITISDFAAVVGMVIGWISINYYVFGIVALLELGYIIFLFISNRQLRGELRLYDTFADDRVSLMMAIRLLLNQKGDINRCRIKNVELLIGITDADSSTEDLDGKRYDCLFSWTMEGVNNQRHKLSKLFFRMAADNSVNLNQIKMRAIQCKEDQNCPCMEAVMPDCMAQSCHKSILQYNLNDIVEKRNFYILPLEFEQPVDVGAAFRLKVSYVWPQCYNPLIEYLIIDPYNFSDEVDNFSVLLQIDGKVINRNTYARVYAIVRKSTQKREIIGVKTLTMYTKGTVQYFRSGNIEVDKKMIYFVEIENR